MAGPTGFPLNQSTYIPGGPLVINGTAVGSNNLISFQLNGTEVANLNQSGVLSTAGGGGIASFGAFGSTPSSAGASVAGSVATLQPADGTHPGGVTTGTQTFAGVKTFSSVPVAAGVTAPASTTLTLTGSEVASGSSVGIIFNNSALLSDSGDKYFSWQANSSEIGNVDNNGNFNWLVAMSLAANFSLTGATSSIVWTHAGAPAILYPYVADGATNIALTVYNQTTLSTAGARLLSLQNVGTETFGVEFTGKIFQTAANNVVAGTSGTANGACGTVLLSSTNDTYTMTNSVITANSLVRVWVQQAAADSTAFYAKNVAVTSHTAVIKMNAVAAANLTLAFEVLN